MEGLSGDHAELDAALVKYDVETLAQMEQKARRPVFLKAQVGFNNNVRYGGATYHVQTEDSGIDRPHIITHLFGDGGRVIKSHKRTYAAEVSRDDIAAYVRSLMKAQHQEMCIALREGRFDEVIAGRAPGGMSVLEGPPEVTVQRGAGEAVHPAIQAAAAAPPKAPVPGAAVRVRLATVRSLWGGPDRYEPRGDDVIIGSAGEIALTGERFCAPKEAVLRFRDGKVSLIDLEGGNGVFVRVKKPVELVLGDMFLVGDQVLCIWANPDPDDAPDPGPTYFYSSPRWPSSFRVVQIWEGGQHGTVRTVRGSTLQIGRTLGDMTFRRDPLIEDQHCVIEEQAGAIVLTDLGTRAGTFVRVTGEHEVINGDEFAIGRTRLRVELP
jgi:pSer/pThr/pTyr-binding forkhead associated (FHA) protein